MMATAFHGLRSAMGPDASGARTVITGLFWRGPVVSGGAIQTLLAGGPAVRLICHVETGFFSPALFA